MMGRFASFLFCLLFTIPISPDLLIGRCDILVPLWPYPQNFTCCENGKRISFKSVVFNLFDRNSNVFVNIESDEFYSNLIEQYEPYLTHSHGQEEDSKQFERSQTRIVDSYPVTFDVGNLKERFLGLNSPEDYVLQVESGGTKIFSSGIFGSLRGIETFTQLVLERTLSHLPIFVQDKPRYPWRGLTVDVARHYLTPDTLRKIVDGLQFNKMNVLHIHFTDSESFPLVVPSRELLSKKGSFHPTKAVFSPQDLKELVRYAYHRGVRIVPEIDIPSHSYSWSLGYPDAGVECAVKKDWLAIKPLDPTQPITYDLVHSVVEHLEDIFSEEEYIHFGCDEVYHVCWDTEDHIREYIKNNSLINSKSLQGLFMNKVFNFTDKKKVVWEDFPLRSTGIEMEYQLERNDDIVVQVWRNPDFLDRVFDAGYKKVLNSAGWYLDMRSPFYWTTFRELDRFYMQDVWKDMYVLEIEDFLSEKYWDGVLGGEACMWGERTNDFVVVEMIFPKTCAVAERLWSTKEINVPWVQGEQYRPDGDEKILEWVTNRLNHHICNNLNFRKIESGPVSSSFCLYNFL